MLIQAGGMGVVTIAMMLFTIFGRRIGLKYRGTMQESISAPQIGGIVKFTGFIIKMTAVFELAGAAVMAPVFCSEFGILKGIWYSLFHSISAFCNAGFDLMGINTPYSSLTPFSTQPVINITIMALITLGGIGFLVWSDIKINKFKFKKYRMQSKVVILTSALLIVIPALYFFFFEYSGVKIDERVFISLFQSVTTRTAGFNTADFGALSEAGIAIVIILMLIGGSPGSTAGGMKTTTVAVMFSTAVSVFMRREHPHFFGRRISDDTVKNAATILTMYITLFLIGGFIISRIEGLPLLTCLFETASAVGTVGLTLGITPQLGIVSHCILILLMYCGRVGALTLVFATLSSRKGNTAKLPQEKLTIG